MRVAINGLGRIGRCITRAIFELGFDKNLDLFAINCSSDAASISHFLRYDSVHGKCPFKISPGDNYIEIGGHRVELFNERDVANLRWNADLLFDCTGAFKTRKKAEAHIRSGAKRVLISSPATGEDATVIYGINHKSLTKDLKILAAGSCTTNCLMPVLKVLQDNIGIRAGFATTIHSYTNDQKVLDSNHTDLRRSRACSSSIIPSSTGAEKLVGEIMPELKDKIGAAALRVPTPNVSLLHLNIHSSSSASVSEINEHFRKASETYLKGILGYVDEPLVSIDLNHDVHSALFDETQTSVIDNNYLKVAAWYDNEWGFAVRMLDIANYLSGLIS